MRTWLHGTQARGNRAHPDNGGASPLVPVAGHVWQSGQRRVPQGVASGGENDPVLRGLAHRLEDSCALLRLDGLYGTGAVLSDLLGLPFVLRGKEYGLLDLPVVQTRLHLPADRASHLTGMFPGPHAL